MTSEPTAADSSGNETLPLRARRRLDLVIAQTGSGHALRWTVKDPISLRYYQLREADHFVLAQLDGRTSVREIQDRFSRQYAPQKLSAGQIAGFVQQLWNQGLVIVDRFGLSPSLIQRHQQIEEDQRRLTMFNLLAIRFRGIDPDRFLTALLPYVGWLFSPICLVLGFVLMLMAGSAVLGDWDALLRDLRQFQFFFRADRLISLTVAIAIVKVLHELGHAFVCKKLGGECHELGLMLLVFTPCLYCNVSDAWLLPKRWQRIAVSAAGIYVELVLASICTFVWLWTVPGVVHSVSLMIMVISSVNTLLLNGNPLLRYDGYYILADIVDMPNLRSRAQGIVKSTVARWCLGLQDADQSEPRGLHRFGILLYGWASLIYGWVVIFGILWMLYRVAKPRNVESLVVAFGIILICGRFFSAAKAWGGFLQRLHHEGRLNVKRLATVSSLVAVLLVAFLLIPFPRRLLAPALIRGAKLHPVFVTSPGQIEGPSALQPGDRVEQGQSLAELKNLELEQELAKLRGQVEQQRTRLDLLQIRQSSDPQAAAGIPSTQSSLRDYEQRLRNREVDYQRLHLTAPIAGIVLQPGSFESPQRADRRLQRQPPPFAERNVGAWLDVGTTYCVLADPEQREAVLYVHQADVTAVSVGDQVTLTSEQTGGQSLIGTVTEVAARNVQHVPPNLTSTGAIAVRPTREGTLEPAQPLHEVRVRLTPTPQALVCDQEGRGAIWVGSESLGTKFIRSLRRTVTFEM